jgi:CRISPR system Cascade subunit CasE
VRVLGYCAASLDELRTHAATFADPLAYAACNLAGMAGKPMPSDWQAGTRLGFEVRTCPIVRHGNEARLGRPATASESALETDAFLAACRNLDPAVRINREEIYLRWLERELGRGGAVRLQSARMLSFRRIRLSRRNHTAPRNLTVCERPDVTLTGTLEIVSSAPFDALLRRGLGRHRAFGFGMLLLKPTANGHA